jgi:hypothetical protein
MKKELGGLATAAALVIGLGAAATAGATPATIHDSVHGNVRIDPTDPSVAYVTGHYICQGGDAESHLWVSVKQAADGRPDPALREEGSSQIANAWLQTHPVPGEGFSCDGAWHTQTFTVDTQEQGFGELKQGQAWVQFCLFGGDGQAAFAQRFAAVR